MNHTVNMFTNTCIISAVSCNDATNVRVSPNRNAGHLLHTSETCILQRFRI